MNLEDENKAGNPHDSGLLFSVSAPDRRRAQAVYDGWLVRFKREGKFAIFAKITPALAEVILERNPANRKVSDLPLSRLETEFSSGLFETNGESIIIANTGELNDGQHRLMGCIRSGTTFETVVAFGVSRESRKTVDQGVRRTPGQQLRMLDYPNATNLAHAGRMLYQLVNLGRISRAPDHQPTTSQIIETVRTYPGLSIVVPYGQRAWSAKLGGVGLFAALRHFAELKAGESTAGSFFEPLATGADLRESDPIYILRTRLQNGRGDRLTEPERAILTAKAWRAYRRGSKIRILKIVPGEDFPGIE